MARLNCPFCWESTTVKELARRCPDECGEEVDTPLSEFNGMSRPGLRRPLAFTADQAQKDGRCPHGRQAPLTRICPHCHNDLEYDYVRTAASSRPIALIGASGSGKSVYVGVLVRELKTRVGTKFNGMAVEFVGDQSRAHYDEVFRVPLFQDNQTLRMTDSLRVSRRLRPLLFSLRIPIRRLRGSRLALAMMVFLDTSGEDVLAAKAMDRLARYLDAAAGIVLIVDPLQMPDVREAVETTVYPTSSTRQIDVVERLGALLREQRGLSPTQRIDKPLAVVLSKIDTLDTVLPDQSALRRQADHDGGYDEADGQLVHDEVRAWIHRWYGEGLINTIDSAFTTSRYFGISALGAPPRSEGHLDPSGIRPLRVEDPLLWLLSRFGFVPRAKGKR
ncbi:TRAFAC clade GTPase domain-containing protein [Frankia sp. AgKG'84/4]|uniref:TRAFAC clade GTPase domain-containing protein n=1 Tax=Frankia sp. AgKG'84/4 TaxID=573490 RepID=UPI00200CCCE5|nr:hypothetical protein [Frankia sp. AgKG'84/4]MCL9793079.1 hypothetical protein [Frankia sp. AgKG'84/4]